MSEKNKIEAVLFTTGRFLGIEEIAKLSSIGSIGYLKTLLSELKEDYSARKSALEVIEEKGKWKLNIHKDYLHLTENLLDEAELDRPTQKTLAMIAYKQPAIQCDVVSARGNKSYDHIRKLKEEGFVTSERFGRTKLLKLSQRFYDYFDVVEDEVKARLSGEEIPVKESDEEKISAEVSEDLKESKDL